jgi:PIN domain nuclease of toxin-antitoxin system
MSGLLLDTHVFIWFSENLSNLPIAIREEIEAADRVYLSIASLWEIAIKLSGGKLALQVVYSDIEAMLPGAGIELISISFDDTKHLLNLPLHHRDPFDRILIAQAIERSMVLVSADRSFGDYPVQKLWE